MDLLRSKCNPPYFAKDHRENKKGRRVLGETESRILLAIMPKGLMKDGDIEVGGKPLRLSIPRELCEGIAVLFKSAIDEGICFFMKDDDGEGVVGTRDYQEIVRYCPPATQEQYETLQQCRNNFSHAVRVPDFPDHFLISKPCPKFRVESYCSSGVSFREASELQWEMKEYPNYYIMRSSTVKLMIKEIDKLYEEQKQMEEEYKRIIALAQTDTPGKIQINNRLAELIIKESQKGMDQLKVFLNKLS